MTDDDTGYALTAEQVAQAAAVGVTSGGAGSTPATAPADVVRYGSAAQRPPRERGLGLLAPGAIAPSGPRTCLTLR